MTNQAVTWHDIEKASGKYTYPDQNSKVLIFGCGLQGINAVSELKEELPIAAFCDNDRQKQGTMISGFPCIAPQEMSQFHKTFVLISSIKHYPAISRQLSAMGLPFCTVDAYVTHKYIERFSQVYEMLGERSKGIEPVRGPAVFCSSAVPLLRYSRNICGLRCLYRGEYSNISE